VWLAIGLLVRLAALPLPGTEDVNVWKVWSYAGSKDVTAVYGVGGDPPVRGLLKYGKTFTTVDYPPVALYELAAVGQVYRAIFPAYPNDWTLVAALKLPGLLAGIGITWLIAATVRRVTSNADHARLAALAYWLNPAVILNAEVLGYLDPLMMLPALASFALLGPPPARDATSEATRTATSASAHAGAAVAGMLWRPGAAGVCLALALLTKPQALLVVPAWLFAFWRWTERRSAVESWTRAAAGGAIASALAVAPFALAGALPNMWLAFGSFYARRDILSGNAANVWWIGNYVSRAVHGVADLGWRAFFVPVARVMAVSTFVEQGLPDPRPFGQAAIALLCGWACWRLRRAIDLSLALALAAFTVHAVFVFGVGVHEHHQLLMVPLLALAAALRPRLRALFAAVSVICALNMNLFYGLGRGWPYALPRMATGLDATVLLSLANIIALAWHARLLARETAEAAPTLAVRSDRRPPTLDPLKGPS
jgi:hypothetical protein